MKLGDVTMSFTHNGELWTFRLGDYTALDSMRFQQAVGMRIPAAFDQPDLHGIAGLMWIGRMKLGEKITFEEVAGDLSYDSIDFHVEGQQDKSDPES